MVISIFLGQVLDTSIYAFKFIARQRRSMYPIVRDDPSKCTLSEIQDKDMLCKGKGRTDYGNMMACFPTALIG